MFHRKSSATEATKLFIYMHEVAVQPVQMENCFENKNSNLGINDEGGTS